MLFGPGSSGPAAASSRCSFRPPLDDASRLIPHAQFYPNQGLDAFLDCLRMQSLARGIPTRLYMDNADLPLAAVAPHRRFHRHPIVHTLPSQPEKHPVPGWDRTGRAG